MLENPYHLVPLPTQGNIYINPLKVSYIQWYPELNRSAIFLDNGDNHIVDNLHPTQLMHGFVTGNYNVPVGQPLPPIGEPSGPTPLEMALRELAIQTLVHEGYTVTPPDAGDDGGDDGGDDNNGNNGDPDPAVAA